MSHDQDIDKLRRDLATQVFDQGFHWRILFLGTSVNGSTDIVASLSRSLRNLGHHVLDIDTRQHDILNNPYNRQGGMGPIFVDYEKIESVLDRFQPQMLICCAGGMTFTPEDAQKIKDRGVVLVGITLSDPDVFPSIRDHQQVFDVHTTNAKIALDMYAEAGYHNTVYFPFGIDRGFITQEIPSSDAFDADVISLGHATNRPERNSTMTAMAAEFDVKTYGRGWEIPGSYTVAGTEMVQALRGGRIHVNFPLTRAGFINIKCGVFESASQARVVATGQFDEMADFFEYDEEIIGYSSDEELQQKIQRLIDNPAEYQRIAFNGFKRVVTEHLYEHRWMALFETIRTLELPQFDAMDPQRRAQIRETLMRSLPRAKKVIISGFYGVDNLGDEMILRSISDRLTATDPAVQVHVAAERPENVERNHGLQAMKRIQHAATGYSVKTASAVLLGGGGLWHDYTFERGGGLAALFNGGKISMAGFGILPMMAKVLELPFHVVGLGVGPLTDSHAAKTVKYIAKQADSIYLRDPESGRLLSEVLDGADEHVTVAPDSVYALDLGRVQPRLPESVKALKREGYTIVGLNMRSWAAVDGDALTARVAAALTEVGVTLSARGEKLAVVAMPMQAGVRYDYKAIDDVFQALPEQVRVLHASSDGKLSIEEYLGVLQESSALLAMRLHASLIAHRVGVPGVGLCYDPKVKRHFDEVVRSEFGLPLDADADVIASSVVRALSTPLPESFYEGVRRLERDAEDALQGVAAAVAAAETSSEVYEVPAEDEVRGYQPPTAEGLAVGEVHFEDIITKADGISPRDLADGGPVSAGLTSLSVGLMVEKPKKGMRVSHSGKLVFDESLPPAVRFRLTNPWSNPKAVGKIFVDIEIGSYSYSVDLAQAPLTAELLYTAASADPVHIRVALRIDRDVFRARSWQWATTTVLEIVGTNPAKPLAEESLIASSGQVRKK